jgi:hypothetical protein
MSFVAIRENQVDATNELYWHRSLFLSEEVNCGRKEYVYLYGLDFS